MTARSEPTYLALLPQVTFFGSGSVCLVQNDELWEGSEGTLGELVFTLHFNAVSEVWSLPQAASDY